MVIYFITLIVINLVCAITISWSIYEMEGKHALLACILFSVPIVALVLSVISLALEVGWL